MSLLIAYLNSYQTDSNHTLSKLSQLSLPMLPNHSMMELSSQSTLMQEEEEAPKLQ